MVTGYSGLIGQHVRCRMLADGIEFVPGELRRGDQPIEVLVESLGVCDSIIHLSGVNRSVDLDLEWANIELADRLAVAIRTANKPVTCVYGNSVQSGNDTPYGRGKAGAARVLKDAVERVGGNFIDVRLPNAFGEGGVPFYNSVVSTFCHQISRGEEVSILENRTLELLHAQEVARLLLEACNINSSARSTLEPRGTSASVSDIRDLLLKFHRDYSGVKVPSLASQFEIELFNTYRSYVFPEKYPVYLKRNIDVRGYFAESIQSLGGSSQTSFSTTAPGITRGEHFHFYKTERFLVLKGKAKIALRHVLREEKIVFEVDGEDPAFVDMPTLWAHNITNVGSDELLTLFWTADVFDPENPDTYRMAV